MQKNTTDDIQHPFIIKALNKVGVEMDFLKLKRVL